jgi:hypothetical protein
LYDFDIGVGDTISLYQWNEGLFYTGFVVQRDSLLIGSYYHSRYYIECMEWQSVQFIEGVGSNVGLMYCDIPWVDLWGNLYCFSLNDTIYKTDGSGEKGSGDCWQYIGIQETPSEQIEVYPNPVRDYIYVNYDKKCKLVLSDLSGRQVRPSFSNFINVSDLEQGIYLLRIYSMTGNLLNKYKILKLNVH